MTRSEPALLVVTPLWSEELESRRAGIEDKAMITCLLAVTQWVRGSSGQIWWGQH